MAEDSSGLLFILTIILYHSAITTEFMLMFDCKIGKNKDLSRI